MLSVKSSLKDEVFMKYKKIYSTKYQSNVNNLK